MGSSRRSVALGAGTRAWEAAIGAVGPLPPVVVSKVSRLVSLNRPFILAAASPSQQGRDWNEPDIHLGNSNVGFFSQIDNFVGWPIGLSIGLG